jgi:hypothetical protein
MSEKETEKGTETEEKKETWFTFGDVRMVINKESEGWTNIAVFFPDEAIRETKLGKSVKFGIMDRSLQRFVDALAGTETLVESAETISETDKKILELGKKIIELVKSSSTMK